MILLGRPYISEFLISTLETNQIPVIHNDVAGEYVPHRNLNLVPEQESICLFNGPDSPLLYTNSENSISWIEKNLRNTPLPGKIKFFKNKILFRNLLQDLYPNYVYKGVLLNAIDNLDVTGFSFPFIVKPVVGFFSLGVHKVRNHDEWKEIICTIKNETESIKELYPVEVLNTSEFIIEECFEGDEFAIDCYFNSDGNPVVLSILKHIFPSETDMNDRVYITSADIIEKYVVTITEFLREIGKRASLSNFPAHVEVRIAEDGTVFPIEVNPLRFGGWCSTPDLAWYAYGINLYEYLFLRKTPDWPALLKGKQDLVYSNIVLNNTTGTEGQYIRLFDYDKLLADFEKPLELRKADYSRFPIFGFLFCETRKANMKELERILMSDLSEYVK